VCAISGRLFLALCCLSVPSLLPRQQGGTPAKEDNLYSVALSPAYLKWTNLGHIDDSDGGSRIHTGLPPHAGTKGHEITDGLPSQLGDYRVEYLDYREQSDKIQKMEELNSQNCSMQSDGQRAENRDFCLLPQLQKA